LWLTPTPFSTSTPVPGNLIYDISYIGTHPNNSDAFCQFDDGVLGCSVTQSINAGELDYTAVRVKVYADNAYSGQIYYWKVSAYDGSCGTYGNAEMRLQRGVSLVTYWLESACGKWGETFQGTYDLYSFDYLLFTFLLGEGWGGGEPLVANYYLQVSLSPIVALPTPTPAPVVLPPSGTSYCSEVHEGDSSYFSFSPIVPVGSYCVSVGGWSLLGYFMPEYQVCFDMLDFGLITLFGVRLSLSSVASAVAGFYIARRMFSI